jgi:hypothetical protein
MPQNRKKQSLTGLTAQSSTQSPVLLPIDPSLPLVVDCPNSSYTAVYPSVYRGGIVDRDHPLKDQPLIANLIVLASIACQAEYSHLSPEASYFTCA